MTDESEAFELCDPDEQRALFWCGTLDKMEWVSELKKCDSMTNLKAEFYERGMRPRTQSAGAKTFWGKPVDFEVHQWFD